MAKPDVDLMRNKPFVIIIDFFSTLARVLCNFIHWMSTNETSANGEQWRKKAFYCAAAAAESILCTVHTYAFTFGISVSLCIARSLSLSS